MSKCEECNKEFASEDALKQHNSSKHYKEKKEPVFSKKVKKSIIIWGSVLIIILGIIFGIGNMDSAKTLPPTSMANHIEVSPPSHVLKVPMQPEIFKHMLEHVDGIEGGRSGVMISYDCLNYECENDLVPNLEAFAEKYDYVYVAPYKNMANKIVLTSLNRQTPLDQYEERTIDFFIGG